MPGNRNYTSDDDVRTYLDEIGRIPLIDHRQEIAHGLAIERQDHITRLRAGQQKPTDCNVTDHLLRCISACAPTISGLSRHAGLHPDPHMQELATEPAFRDLVDYPLSDRVKDVARRWSGIADEKDLAAHLRRISLDTASLTDAAIHLTDNCRISRLQQHLEDPDYLTRRNVMSRHLTRQLDQLVAAGDAHQKDLADANLRLVVAVAREYTGYNMPMMDLIQEGNIGILVSVQRYNHRMGTRFSTYATWWIRHHIVQCLNKQGRTIRLPEHQIKLINRISAARRALTQELGRNPTDVETAEHMGLELASIQNADLIRQEPANLDEPISEDGDTLLQHTIPSNTPSVEQEVEQRELPQVVRRTLEQLPEKERKVLTLRYGLVNDAPLTIGAIAKELGVSNHQVREIEKSAIAKLQTLPELRRIIADFAN